MKRILQLLMTLILVITLIPTVSADRTLPLLVDDASLLDFTEAESLLVTLEKISERIGIEVAVVTVDSLDGKTAMAYADDFYDENGYGSGDGDDGVMLLVAMEEREFYMTTHGYAQTMLTDYALYRIEDAFLYDLSNASYYDAFLTFANQCELYITGSESKDPEYYDDGYYDDGYYEQATFDVGSSLLISLIIGFVVALIIVLSMKGSMTTVRSAVNAQNYVDANSLRLHRQNDQFLYRRTTRTPRADTSSSSRSGGSSHRSSSHRSSSGRSHGGRGGRF